MASLLRIGHVRAGLIATGALLVVAAAWAALSHRLQSSDALPVLGTVPEFSLIGSSGKTITQADLAGGIWVADFIFTECPGLCPTLSAQMAKLQNALVTRGDSDVRLVSFSVDPANDTPEVLRAYAGRFHADPSRWWFVTGERVPLYSLIRNGFRLAVAERSPSEDTDGGGLITHSDRFVLVDRSLQIRAYYHGTEADSLQRMLQDIESLRHEHP
jgi:protein SCO1/2